MTTNRSAGMDTAHLERRGRSYRPGAVLLIVLAVLAGHGLSFWHGLSFDDHLHRLALREGDWSLGALVRAARVGETEGAVEFWWSDQPFVWGPFRPFCFLLMKIEYLLVGWHPAGMHGFGLLWHTGCALQVTALAGRFLGDGRWALLAGVLFALHPGHGATCERIADQNEVMATFFVLASVGAYARHAGWPSGALDSAFQPAASGGPLAGRPGWLALALVLTAAGLGCRENAVVVPALVFIFDLLIGKLSWRWRLGGYACFAVLTAGFLLLRFRVLGGLATPGLPYMYPLGEPGLLRYLVDKLLFYQLALYLYVPALQLTFFEFFQARPALLYGLAGAVLAALAFLLVRLAGSSRAGWGLLLWPMICLGPVLFVFAGLHHLYMPSTGSSILLVGLLMHLDRMGRSAFWGRVRASVVLVGLVGYAGGSLVTSVFCYRLTEVERGYADRLAAAVDGARDGDHVFVLNYPTLAFYTPPAVVEATGTQDLSIQALSVRPRWGGWARAVAVDARRLVLWIPTRSPPDGETTDSGRPFEALAERQITLLVPASAGLGDSPPAGTVRPGGEFEARFIGADEQGVAVWLLEFDRPLASPRYHFCAFTKSGPVERMPLTPLEHPARELSGDILEAIAGKQLAPANG